MQLPASHARDPGVRGLGQLAPAITVGTLGLSPTNPYTKNGATAVSSRSISDTSAGGVMELPSVSSTSATALSVCDKTTPKRSAVSAGRAPEISRPNACGSGRAIVTSQDGRFKSYRAASAVRSPLGRKPLRPKRTIAVTMLVATPPRTAHGISDTSPPRYSDSVQYELSVTTARMARTQPARPSLALIDPPKHSATAQKATPQATTVCVGRRLPSTKRQMVAVTSGPAAAWDKGVRRC